MNAPDRNIKVGDTHYEIMMKGILRIVKEMPKHWRKMTEGEQDVAIAQFDQEVKEALRNAVIDIAADGRASILVELEQVVFKDGIKAAVKLGRNAESRHQLADAVGSAVVLVLADARPYTKGERPKGEPAQKDLTLGMAVSDAIGDAAKRAEEAAKKKKEDEYEAEKKKKSEDGAAAEARAARDEAGALNDLVEAGFNITAAELTTWTLEMIVDARACAAAFMAAEDGEEINLPPILQGRQKKE